VQAIYGQGAGPGYCVMTQLGLLIYCFLLLIRPADWVPSILHWPLEFSVLGTTAVIASIRAWKDRANDEAPPISRLIQFVGLWLFAILLSNVSKGNFDEAGSITFEYVKKCIIALTFWLALRSIGNIRSLTLIMVVLAGALGYQGIYQKAHGFGWAGQHLYWDNRICWIGLWDGANVLSLVFVTAVPFAFEIIVGKWNWIFKLIALGSLGLMLTGLVLAASRGGWVALAVTTLIYFSRRIGKRSGSIISLVLLAGFAVIAPSRLSRNDERDSSSTSGRIDMWAEGVEMYKSNPVFGIGKGQFINYTHMLIAHNAFVQNMGETGTFGLFAWVGLIYLAYKSLRIVHAAGPYIADKRILRMNDAVFASLTGYLSASMFISTDFDLLYLMLGLAGAMLVITRRETGLPLEIDFSRRDARNVLCCVFSGVIIISAITMGMSH
jgi:putative inorganic carbon (hco3(-)) transporter